MINELLWALEDARDADATCASIVLTGEGKAFCAGGDFAQMTAGAAERRRSRTRGTTPICSSRWRSSTSRSSRG